MSYAEENAFGANGKSEEEDEEEERREGAEVGKKGEAVSDVIGLDWFIGIL